MRVFLAIGAILLYGLAHGATFTVSPGQSIQAAIDAALPGDIIEVEWGAYQENINITKRLTLRAVNVTRKGIDIPVIVAGNKGDAIAVSADGVVLEGFAATQGFAGIAIRSSNNTIAGNYANYNRDFGMVIISNNKNNLTNNTAIQNGKAGIFLSENTSSNSVKGNKVAKNPFGILVESSAFNNLFSNNCLLENKENANDFGANQWDDGSLGNYYDDLACQDINKDGICDIEYNIPGGSSIDRYPLARQPA